MDLSAVREATAFLQPWEFSPAVFALCAGSAVLYVAGLTRTPRAERPHGARTLAFLLGCGLVYFVMQTRFDFLSQHMFFVHRIQHLVLHHLGPFLVALSQPLPTLARGLPAGFADRYLVPVWRHAVTRATYRVLQNALVAPVLFVGLIFFWLEPAVHFDAMLSAPRYALMNWSMLLDGLLFWALLFDPRTREQGAPVGLGLRIWLALLAIPPQIWLGAHIALADHDIFDVYAICGRVWDFTAREDQGIGGIMIWIPASMMHVAAVLILIGRWMRADRDRASPPKCAAA
ncbi:MAG: cytochrome c oxidase assembly protein [Burkholderiales bacterium]